MKLRWLGDSGFRIEIADKVLLLDPWLSGNPEIGILSAGGHFTMDMKRAAWAARKFFDFKTVIPCHYRTFPLLEQSAEVLRAALPGVRVIEPEVMQPIEL